MLEAAYNALEQIPQRPLLIGVTILTSMQTDDLEQIGIHAGMEQTVLRLAHMAKNAGLDGVVCSPHEIKRLRAETGNAFKLVTPGIRPLYSGRDDQQRTLPPAKALRLGSDYLVIGRPVTAAPDPLQALHKIMLEIAGSQTEE